MMPLSVRECNSLSLGALSKLNIDSTRSMDVYANGPGTVPGQEDFLERFS